MKHNIKSITAIASTILTIICSQTSYADNNNWFIRPNVGLSALSDFSSTVSGAERNNGNVDIDIDSGFVTGFGIGYKLNNNLMAELAWEYRANDSSVTLPNASISQQGNFASNTFFLNGLYQFNPYNAWKPYLGAGLSWIQEVDIDLEFTDSELSYSSNGDLGFQVFGGIAYDLSEKWQLQAELRYTNISGIDLESEFNNTGRFTDIDYAPNTFQLALVYDF